MHKIKILILLITTFVLAACSSDLSVKSGALQFELNKNMEINLLSETAGTGIFHKNFYSSDQLIAQEIHLDDFTLENISKSSDAKGTHYTVTGLFKENGFKVRKQQTISVLNNFPDMLFFETAYINEGEKELNVTAWKNHEIRVDDIANEDLIWSFQPSSSNRRDDWILPVEPGFYQKNYLGMNNSDYGGGMPIVNLWRRDGGVSIGLTEETLKMISMPVKWVRYDKYATMSLLYEYDKPHNFAKNDTIHTYNSFMTVHTGDFFNPLHQFSEYMQAEGGLVFAESQPEAYEPVWCAWGYERMFTIDEVIGTLPKVKELGFKWVDVDDGYQIAEGDWETNSRFPGGDRDMRRMTDAIHSYDLKAKLWWAPLAADPGTNHLERYPETMLLTDEWIPRHISWWDSYYLSPVNPVTKEYTDKLLERFLVTWNFDGLKLDGQHLNMCPPDHNPHSKLSSPVEAAEQLPTYFKQIFDVAQGYKKYSVIQNCPCGTAMNFFNIPYMNQAVASDPTSSFQVRLKGKAYRAIKQDLAYYADHIELSDNGDDFGTQIGIGGVIGSKFTYPKDNPHVKKSYILTPEKEKLYKKWIGIYNDKMIAKGTYLNLYDIAYDIPESHVFEKDNKLYYAFYADEWNGKIELRGLEKGKTYMVNEYTEDEEKTYTVSGDDPFISPTFNRNYLIEVYQN